MGWFVHSYQQFNSTHFKETLCFLEHYVLTFKVISGDHPHFDIRKNYASIFKKMTVRNHAQNEYIYTELDFVQIHNLFWEKKA